MRRGGCQPAAGTAQNLALCDILREQPGRRPARDCVKRRTAAGPVCATAIDLSVITYFCLLSISDGALGRKRRGKCWWGDGRDRQIRIFRCSKRNFRLRLYRNNPLSAVLCSCKRVRLSDFLRKFAERIFPLWPTDSCKRGRSCPSNHNTIRVGSGVIHPEIGRESGRSRRELGAGRPAGPLPLPGMGRGNADRSGKGTGPRTDHSPTRNVKEVVRGRDRSV